MALAALLLILAACFDRLLKNFALLHQGLNIPLLGNWLQWQPVVNPVGPLGLSLPDFLLPTILGLLLGGLGLAIFSESQNLLRGFLILAAIGVVSNYTDRFNHGYIVDIFSFFSLAFNLADIYIVVAIMGYLIWTVRQAGRLTILQNNS